MLYWLMKRKLPVSLAEVNFDARLNIISQTLTLQDKNVIVKNTFKLWCQNIVNLSSSTFTSHFPKLPVDIRETRDVGLQHFNKHFYIKVFFDTFLRPQIFQHPSDVGQNDIIQSTVLNKKKTLIFSHTK